MFKTFRQHPLLCLVLGMLVAVIFIPTLPSLRPPGGDNGSFLYMGWRILEGQVMYRDIWDHKPPAIHFLNALGLYLGGGSAWGVWILEWFMLFMAAVIGFAMMKDAFGFLSALFASLAWPLALTIVIGGNMTEEFTLFFQFLALALFWRSEKSGHYGYRGFLIGVTAAIAFCLKQNMVGLWLAIALYCLVTRVARGRWGELIAIGASMLAGSAALFGGLALYFSATGALAQFWDSAFLYNFVYTSEVPLKKVFRSAYDGLGTMYKSGITIFALPAWILGVLSLIMNRQEIRSCRPLVGLAIVVLPLEILLATLSGKAYGHYFVPWVPVFAILAAFGVHFVLDSLPRSSGRSDLKSPAALWLGTVLVAMSVIPLYHTLVYPVLLYPSEPTFRTLRETASWIRKNTDEDSSLLVWGSGARLNFMSRRPAPTRMFVQLALYTKGYTNPAMIGEFYQDLVNKRPLIVSRPQENIPPLEAAKRKDWQPDSDRYAVLPEAQKIFDFISENYTAVETLGPGQWVVYRYGGNNATSRAPEKSSGPPVF